MDIPNISNSLLILLKMLFRLSKNDATLASGKVTAQSPVVEVFSAMANGEEIGKFGKKGDAASTRP